MSLFSQKLDDAIVERARRGDSKAQEIVYRTFSSPVYSLARRVLNRPDQAEEVLQDTFVEVIRHLDSFRGQAPLGAWIRSIAMNKCLMYLRSGWHRYARPTEPGLLAEQISTRDNCAAPTEALNALEEVFAQLSPAARMVVWMYDVEGYTHREIGELMNKTPSFSKSQLARAHKRLRELLGPKDGSDKCMQA